MAGLTSALCTSWKVELGQAVHNHTASTGHTFKLALVKKTPTGTYGAASANYSNITGNADEVANGNGYTTAGWTLTSATPVASGTTAVFDFTSDISQASSTFDTDGCMIYNSSASGKAVSVHDFGGTKSPSAGTFAITFPTPDASNAIYRLA
jgi:hypothetical protein